MSEFSDVAKLKFNYLKLSAEERLKLLEKLKKELKGVTEISFAYVHGGFIERDFFRDLDVAVWLKNSHRAFHYTVSFSAKLEIKMRVPVDLQVLNGAPLPFKFHVFTRGRLLFSKDESLRVRLADEVVREYIYLKQLGKFIRGPLELEGDSG